jgi:hypothetical protein
LNENYPSAKITPEHKRQRKLRRLPAEAVQLTSSGRISISKPEWMEASGDDQTFIQDWNSQVKNNEKTDDLVSPSLSHQMKTPRKKSGFADKWNNWAQR